MFVFYANLIFSFIVPSLISGLVQSQSVGQLNKKSFAIAPFSTHDSFLSGSNAVYVDQMYSAWKKNPDR
jgi:hypothetical protein